MAYSVQVMVEDDGMSVYRLVVRGKIVSLRERVAWAARAFSSPCFVTFWPRKRLSNYPQH